MPTLDSIADHGSDVLKLPSLPWLARAVSPGLTRGGIYLVAGEPGIGKSTLANQILGGLATQGTKSLYLTTEQGLPDLKRAVERIHGAEIGGLPDALRENLFFDDSLQDIDSLPHFLARRVLTKGEDYHGIQCCKNRLSPREVASSKGDPQN